MRNMIYMVKKKRERDMIISLICREYNKKKKKTKTKLSYVVYQGMEFDAFHINSIKIVIVPSLQTFSGQTNMLSNERKGVS